MAETFDALVDRATATLKSLGAKKKILSGPIETWPIAYLLDVLNLTVRSLDDIGEIVRLNGCQSAQFSQEHLRHAEAFYTKMQQLGYGSVGDVIAAFRCREVPEQVAVAAAQNAYLHSQVRQAISQGYGITPLEPPRLR